jgi:hypothetical protein
MQHDTLPTVTTWHNPDPGWYVGDRRDRQGRDGGKRNEFAETIESGCFFVATQWRY